MIDAVKIFCEFSVEHQIHNALLPRVQVDGALLAVGIELQLNTRPVAKLSFGQLLVQAGNILQ